MTVISEGVIAMKKLFSKVISLMAAAILCAASLGLFASTTSAAGGISTDGEAALNGSNWMSGISGDRYLHEINIPGTHDSGIADAWTAYLYAKMGYGGAITQSLFIPQQLTSGFRLFDIRLTDYGRDNWTNNDYSVWICHGTFLDSLNMVYYGCDENEYVLRFDTVMGYFADFLRENPTETLIVSITREYNRYNKIYERAKNTLDKWAGKINPATGKSFIYTENGNTLITKMPQLKDTRGQIVITSRDTAELKYGMTFDNTLNGYQNVTVGGIPISYENHYEATDEEKVDYVKKFFEGGKTVDGKSYNGAENPSAHKNQLPNDVTTHLTAGNFVYTSSNRVAKAGQHPDTIAKYVNPELFTKTNAYFKSVGTYFGWISGDFMTAEMAETIWMDNFPDTLNYCTVTYTAENRGDTEETSIKVLKGSGVTLPGNMFPVPEDTEFAGWKDASGQTCSAGEEITVDKDMVLTASFGMSWNSLRRLFSTARGEITVNLNADVTAGLESAGILVRDDATVHLNMNGHTIDGGGGGTLSPHNIFTVYGTLDITGPGTIEGGLALTGGAISVAPGGNLNLNNVTITDNLASDRGGAVYAASLSPGSYATVNLNSVQITGNAAGRSGGGIYVDKYAKVSVVGMNIVTGNTLTDNSENNLFLNNKNTYESCVITVPGVLDTASRIGVSLAEGPASGEMTITSGLERNGNAASFLSDGGIFEVISDGYKEAAFKTRSASLSSTAGSFYEISFLSAAKLADEETIMPEAEYELTVRFEGEGVDAYEQKVMYGVILEEPEAPESTGREFEGWFMLLEDADLEGVLTILEDVPELSEYIWIDGDEVLLLYEFDVPVISDTVLRARWEDDDCFVFFYDDDDLVDIEYTQKGQPLSAMPADPDRVGSVFTGWYTDPECTKLYDSAAAVYDDFELFAGWRTLYCVVSFDSAGGSKVESVTVPFNTKVTKPVDPTRSGYKFAGWYEKVMEGVTEADFDDMPELKKALVFRDKTAYIAVDFDYEIYEDTQYVALWDSARVTSPKTGQTGIYGAAVLLLAALAGIAACLLTKNKRKN